MIDTQVRPAPSKEVQPAPSSEVGPAPSKDSTQFQGYRKGETVYFCGGNNHARGLEYGAQGNVVGPASGPLSSMMLQVHFAGLAARLEADKAEESAIKSGVAVRARPGHIGCLDFMRRATAACIPADTAKGRIIEVFVRDLSREPLLAKGTSVASASLTGVPLMVYLMEHGEGEEYKEISISWGSTLGNCSGTTSFRWVGGNNFRWAGGNKPIRATKMWESYGNQMSPQSYRLTKAEFADEIKKVDKDGTEVEKYLSKNHWRKPPQSRVAVHVVGTR